MNCVTKDPAAQCRRWLRLQLPVLMQTAARSATRYGNGRADRPHPAQYQKFTSQDELGHFLVDHYKIRTPKDLTSCEVCHR